MLWKCMAFLIHSGVWIQLRVSVLMAYKIGKRASGLVYIVQNEVVLQRQMDKCDMGSKLGIWTGQLSPSRYWLPQIEHRRGIPNINIGVLVLSPIGYSAWYTTSIPHSSFVRLTNFRIFFFQDYSSGNYLTCVRQKRSYMCSWKINRVEV